MRRMRIAVALMVGSVVVFGFPVGAVAADDAAAPSRLTIGGQPLARLVRTEPTAPFVAFDAAPMRLGTQDSGAEQASGAAQQSGMNRGKIVLISAAIGAGLGLAMGSARCGNEGSRSCPILALWGGYGLGVGVGVGALVAAFSGN